MYNITYHTTFINKFSDTWKFLNGRLLNDEFPWGQNEPDGGEKETCLSFSPNYGYQDSNCEKKYRYLCQLGNNKYL